MRDRVEGWGLGTPMTRRAAVARGLALAGGALATVPARPAATSPRQATPAAHVPGDQAEAIVAVARDAMEHHDLKAVIVRVTIAGQEIVTTALGESMTGVPATSEMHFRNGNVAIAYIATLLLRLVDQQVVTLDDPLSNWLPDLPDAERVTLRMLANMTAGYPDFAQNATFQHAFYTDPFRQWTPEEQIAIALSTPRAFTPGANWDYSHTNYVILGLALEKITGQPLDAALQDQVLAAIGLRNTVASATPAIPEPALHAFSSERRETLGIPPGTRFSEESTYWNPSWTLAQGAIQTTDIADMATTAVAIGEGTLLSPASHRAQVSPDLVGFGTPLAGCPTCRTLDQTYNYGLGVFLSGAWILQAPQLSGYAGVMAYQAAEKIAIALVTTFGEGSFDDQGGYKQLSHMSLFSAIGAFLAPDDPQLGA